MWDALSGEEELTLQHKHIVKSVNFSNDSAALATASNDKVLCSAVQCTADCTVYTTLHISP